MKILADSTVFASSFFSAETRPLIDAWKNGQVTLCLSPAVVDEYVAVLKRLGTADSLIKELLSLFAQGYYVLFTAVTPSLSVTPDSADNKFIETAVALGCDRIVAGPALAAALPNYMGIRILPQQEIPRLLTEACH